MIKYHIYNDKLNTYIGEFYSKREANKFLQDLLLTGQEDTVEHYRIQEEQL